MLGISPQGAASHQRFASKYSLNFPLLIDPDTKVANAYGAFKDDGAELTVRLFAPPRVFVFRRREPAANSIGPAR